MVFLIGANTWFALRLVVLDEVAAEPELVGGMRKGFPGAGPASA